MPNHLKKSAGQAHQARIPGDSLVISTTGLVPVQVYALLIASNPAPGVIDFQVTGFTWLHNFDMFD